MAATEGLTADEKRRFDVRILVVPFPERMWRGGAFGPKNRVREQFQREYLNSYLLSTFPKHVVHVSDVDEFLDPSSVATSLALDERNPQTTTTTAPCISRGRSPSSFVPTARGSGGSSSIGGSCAGSIGSLTANAPCQAGCTAGTFRGPWTLRTSSARCDRSRAPTSSRRWRLL